MSLELDDNVDEPWIKVSPPNSNPISPPATEDNNIKEPSNSTPISLPLIEGEGKDLNDASDPAASISLPQIKDEDLSDTSEPARLPLPLPPIKDKDLSNHLNHLLHTLQTAGAEALRRLIPKKPTPSPKQLRFLISLLSYHEIPRFFPNTFATPNMSCAINNFIRQYGLSGQHSLALVCNEALVELLADKKQRLEQINEGLDRLVPWREELEKHRKEMIKQRKFEAGEEREMWDMQWDLYDSDREAFGIIYNALELELVQMVDMEKHIRRAETLITRSFEGRWDTVSGRK